MFYGSEVRRALFQFFLNAIITHIDGKYHAELVGVNAHNINIFKCAIAEMNRNNKKSIFGKIQQASFVLIKLFPPKNETNTSCSNSIVYPLFRDFGVQADKCKIKQLST